MQCGAWDYIYIWGVWGWVGGGGFGITPLKQVDEGREGKERKIRASVWIENACADGAALLSHA